MSSLDDELRKDPTAVFEIECDLPTGKHMSGTVGPVINGAVLANVKLTPEPVTQGDIDLAVKVLEQAMGVKRKLVSVSHSAEESANAQREMRKILGGGLG